MVDRPTLETEMFALGQKQLETRVIIKISTHPCQTLTDFHGNEAKHFYFYFFENG